MADLSDRLIHATIGFAAFSAERLHPRPDPTVTERFDSKSGIELATPSASVKKRRIVANHTPNYVPNWSDKRARGIARDSCAAMYGPPALAKDRGLSSAHFSTSQSTS
jgi:hypothetical protein